MLLSDQQRMEEDQSSASGGNEGLLALAIEAEKTAAIDEEEVELQVVEDLNRRYKAYSALIGGPDTRARERGVRYEAFVTALASYLRRLIPNFPLNKLRADRKVEWGRDKGKRIGQKFRGEGEEEEVAMQAGKIPITWGNFRRNVRVRAAKV